MIDLNVTFIIITKNRPQMIKSLIESILKAKLDSFSLVLIDDSNSDNFFLTKDFLQLHSISSLQLSSSQAGRHVEQTLEKINLTPDEKRFIIDCTGLRSPFLGHVERFFEQDKKKPRMNSVGLRFAPYSSARNLGIYCAMKNFSSDIIFLLDDDCLILHPEKLRNQLRLMKTKLNQREIVAIAGIYKNLLKLEPEKGFKREVSKEVLEILQGIEAFLRKSFAVEKTRFQIMPPHMLGGALILSKRVFCSIPFDPYVARGEDHAYAWDLKQYLGKNEIVVRDNHFVVLHQRDEVSKKHIDVNVLRDIFRFVYMRAKTGRSFIPLFIVRWALSSLIRLFLNPSNYVQYKNELLALLFLAPRFAKENACKYKQNTKAWNKFLNQAKNLDLSQ